MTKTTHTPGPWTWTLKPYGELTDDDACAEVSVVNSAGEATANAHLIAAAPDLLRACEVALECADMSGAVRARLTDAVEKARGGA